MNVIVISTNCSKEKKVLHQYDTGQILQFDEPLDDGIHILMANNESATAKRAIVENNKVQVPDELLLTAGSLIVCIVYVNENSETTQTITKIPILPRKEGDNEIAPEHQQTFIEQVQGIMNDTKAAAKEAKEAVENFELTDEQIADIATQVDLTNYYEKAQIDTKLNKKMNVYTGEGAPSSTMNEYEDFVTPSLYFDEKSMELYTLFAAGGSVVANFKHPDSRNIYSKTEVDIRIKTAIDEAVGDMLGGAS